MAYSKVAVFLVAVASALSAQSHAASVGPASVPAHATLPIVFTETLTAAHAKTGDVFHAGTTQATRLADGREVRSGALVTGQDPSVIGLSSTHDSPEIPKHSTALLEFTPQSANGN